MSPPTDAPANHDQIRQGRFWWVTVIRGVFSILLGLALVLTQSNRAMLADFIGAYWLVSGLLTIRWAVTVRWRRGTRVGLVAGSASVIAATLVLVRDRLHELISPRALVDVLGVAAILTGSLRLLGAFEVQRRTGRRWTLGGIALGSVEIALGLVLFFVREENERGYALLFAAWGLIGGSLLLLEGLRLRRLSRSEAARGEEGARHASANA
jgi:uncharacterized membrane protein HdeD (DUF308 family)